VHIKSLHIIIKTNKNRQTLSIT